MMTEIGKLIKEKREEKQLSKRELAKLIKVSNTEIGRIESGERKYPAPDILKKLAQELNLTYRHLLELAGYSDLVVVEKSFTNEAALGYMILMGRLLLPTV